MAERSVPPPTEPASSAVCTGSGSRLDLVAMRPPPPARLVHPHDTYIVQVQKDRIYRVPPPENAYLAERYREGRAGGGKSGSTCSPSVLRTVGVVVAAALLLAAAVVLSIVVLRPDAPSFSINKLSVHNPSRQQHTDYDIFLTAINPNKLTALWYKDGGGTAKLLHQGTTLAEGGVGEPADGGEDATDFNALLHGSKHDGRAPDKALVSSKHAVSLELSAEIPVQVHVGALGFGEKRLAVACSISAAGLRREVHILSHNCRSSFRN